MRTIPTDRKAGQSGHGQLQYCRGSQQGHPPQNRSVGARCTTENTRSRRVEDLGRGYRHFRLRSPVRLLDRIMHPDRQSYGTRDI
mgnify:CR=1 FL=1